MYRLSAIFFRTLSFHLHIVFFHCAATALQLRNSRHLRHCIGSTHYRRSIQRLQLRTQVCLDGFKVLQRIHKTCWSCRRSDRGDRLHNREFLRKTRPSRHRHMLRTGAGNLRVLDGKRHRRDTFGDCLVKIPEHRTEAASWRGTCRNSRFSDCFSFLHDSGGFNITLCFFLTLKSFFLFCHHLSFGWNCRTTNNHRQYWC